MELKRNTHQTYNTKLIETYSYYNRDHVLLDKLRELLKKENVIFKPRDTKSIFKQVTEKDKSFGSEITNLITTFINLTKSRQLTYNDIVDLFSDKSKTGNEYMLERQDIFLKFALPILKKYDNLLKEKTEIDFNDMINQATHIVNEYKPEYTYQYIIIDEYQDISYSRFNLIKQIRDITGARLICVGD
ncbi:MAG: UvrD-helicase domain-containing protein, partial [Bacteroidota bacterium]